MFNSNFHKNSFICALRKFLNQFPDHNELSYVNIIEKKSIVSYLGLDLKKFDEYKINNNNNIPIILWNHRWEYDKNPEDFFNTMESLSKKCMKFELAILGESFIFPMIFFASSIYDDFIFLILPIVMLESHSSPNFIILDTSVPAIVSNSAIFSLLILYSIYSFIHETGIFIMIYLNCFKN